MDKLPQRLFSCLLTLALGSASATPTQVFRSVDEAGNIIYSDEPAADALSSEPVALPKAPSAESVERARSSARSAAARADELAKQRLEIQRAREASRPTQVIYPPPEAAPSRPVYGVPAYPFRPRPWPPHHGPRPGYGANGDHPAYRPIGPRPRPRPTPLPVAPPTGGRVHPPSR